jgi:hypothetical protein
MPLRPVKKSRLYESAVDQIRSLILANKYEPGDRLPSEREERAFREVLKIGGKRKEKAGWNGDHRRSKISDGGIL